MNERIRELAIQTVGDYSKDNYWPFFEEELEKFTQLIIQECATIADTERPNSVGCGYITKTKGMLIKEHFGVEE